MILKLILKIVKQIFNNIDMGLKQSKYYYKLDVLNFKFFYNGNYEFINIHNNNNNNKNNNKNIDTIFEFYYSSIKNIMENIKTLTLNNKYGNISKINYKNNIEIYMVEFEFIIKNINKYIDSINRLELKNNQNKIIKFKNQTCHIILETKHYF